MLRRLRAAGLVWPTVFALPALAVLVALGIWQWQRHAWKLDLLARLEQSSEAPPASLGEILNIAQRSEIRFRRVRLQGRFEHDREFHVWSPGGDGPAWRIITPLRLTSPIGAGGGGPVTSVLIIRGTVRDGHKSPASRQQAQIADEQIVVGRIRFASINWATPQADLARNAWYGLDLDGMRARLARGEAKAAPGSGAVAPFFVEGETAAGPPPAPQPDLARLKLRNRHLEYALTWWGLALTLIGVYAGFANVRLRRLDSPS